MKSAIASTLALALVAAASAPLTIPNALADTTRADASKTPRMSTSEFRRWQRNWDRRLMDMWETDPKSYAWGNEKRPIKAYVAVLDPPLPDLGTADKVTVEWFFAPIDERTGTLAPSNASIVMRKWEKTIKEAGEKRIHIIPRIVSQGPGVPERFEDQLELIQDMIYAWGDNPWKGTALTARAALVNAKRSMVTITEKDVTEILNEAGLDSSVWVAKREMPETEERRTVANSRYQEAMRQAAAQNRRYLNTPQDPVLLIDGKYLLTGYMTKHTRRLFRMANSIIRTRIGVLEASKVASVSGKPEIVDGDELRFGEQVVKLWGVQVPDRAWCLENGLGDCEDDATLALKRIIRRKDVSCEWPKAEKTWTDGMRLASCEIRHRNNRPCSNRHRCNLSVQMAREGAAIVVAKYNMQEKGDLVPVLEQAEANAKRARTGIWRRNDAEIPVWLWNYR